MLGHILASQPIAGFLRPNRPKQDTIVQLPVHSDGRIQRQYGTANIIKPTRG